LKLTIPSENGPFIMLDTTILSISMFKDDQSS
jgi:hypothetical protein